MRKFALIVSLLACLGLSGCYAGPHQLKRTVDDWDQKTYVKQPWVNAVLWVVPVFPILHFGAGLGDFFVVDAWTFWAKDAWDGKGTGFRHYNVEHTDGAMSSLLMDDSSFMGVN